MAANAAAAVSFGEDAAYVALDRLRADEELLGQCRVGQTLSHQRQDLALALASATIAFTDRFDPLFPVGSLIGVWAAAAGVMAVARS